MPALRLAAHGLLTDPASRHAGAPTALLCTDLAAAVLYDLNLDAVPAGGIELGPEQISVGQVRSLLEAAASALRCFQSGDPSVDLAVARALMHVAEALAELRYASSSAEDLWPLR